MLPTAWLASCAQRASQSLAARCRGQYTRIGAPRGEGATAGAIDWHERLQPLLVSSRAALLCLELRRVKHLRAPSGELSRRSKGGAADHTERSYVTLGAVRARAVRRMRDAA